MRTWLPLHSVCARIGLCTFLSENMMANIKRPSDVLNKKMPENPRYKHVKPVVDSGASLRKYLDVIEDLRRNFKYRKDEVFKRIKLQTLVSLMVEVAKLKHKKLQLNVDKTDRLSPSYEQNNNLGQMKSGSTQPGLQSLIMGIGELDTVDKGSSKSLKKASEAELLPSDDPYLLLDVRNQDEFASCHIVSAENYPASMLSRTMDFESKSLLQFKNQPGKIIVMYDDDELRAPKVATTLVQRGYDNIYMLSGGLKYASEKFKCGLIVGTLPMACQTRSKCRRNVTSASTVSSAASFKRLPMHDTLDVNNVALLEQQLQGLFVDGELSCSVSGNSTTSSTITRGSVVSKPSKTANSSRMPSRSQPWK